jgi:hypothetical protein
MLKKILKNKNSLKTRKISSISTVIKSNTNFLVKKQENYIDFLTIEIEDYKLIYKNLGLW